MVQKPVNTSLRIPNSLDYLPLCSGFIEINARLIGFTPEEIQAISLATEEAISNTIQHAYTPGQYDTIEISCWQTPLGIEIIIKEKGMPFDTKTFPDFDPGSIGDGDPHGMGLYLIKQTVDEVIYTNRGSEGNETHLIKYVTQCPIDDMAYEDNSQEKKKNQQEKRQANFEIRKLGTGEAIEVSRAIYRVYGYNYFNEHAYYPERIERLNISGNLVTAAAVTEDSVFAGTCAIYREDLDGVIGELEQAVVLPEYRGNRCMEKLLHYLREIAIENKLLGLFAKSETSEIYAQRALQRLGTKDCALLLGFTNKLVWNTVGNQRVQERESFLLSYLPLREDAKKGVYVPEHHLTMVKLIYRQIGYEREYLQSKRGKKPWHDASELDIKHFYNTSTAVIKVSRFGKDIVSKLKEAKKEVKLKKFSVIYLYLSLENPFTPVYFEKIESLDFFFAGILPHDSTGDAIILQYLNNIEIRVNELDLYTDFSQQLAKYISQCRIKEPLRMLIDSGESDKLEFKSTLRWNLKENKKDNRMGFAVLKTVAAFLNTEGGTLLVGVQDDGCLLGIEIEDFANEDKYLLHFSHLIQHNIGLENSKAVTYNLVELEGKKILKIDCEPATKPIYLRIEGQEEFLIRSGPASKKLSISEAVSYISERF
jgi:serine/threonine-protein kinase RsbW